jgi:hypothetical protein
LPCFDGRENIAATHLADEKRQLERRLDNVTRAACELGRYFRNSRVPISALTPATRKWLLDHEKFDRSRKGK